MVTPCLPPTLLDGLDQYISAPDTKIVQTYLTPRLDNITHKNIVLCYIGEYHRSLFTDKKFVVVNVHDYPQNVRTTHDINFIHCPLLYSYYAKVFDQVDLNYGKEKSLHFLCLTNRAEIDRQSMFYFFNKFSLLDKSLYSYNGDLSRTDFASYSEISDLLTTNGSAWYLRNLDFSALNQTIPYTISGDNFQQSNWNLGPPINDWGIGDARYYENTFCSIVMESYTYQEFPFFTEKIFKPIAYYHPFILHGNPNSLLELQDMGFKTFGDFWDESYDRLGQNQRLESIFQLILEISTWSLEKINAIHHKMLPILEHNRNHFFNTLPQMFDDYKPELFKKIKAMLHETT